MKRWYAAALIGVAVVVLVASLVLIVRRGAPTPPPPAATATLPVPNESDSTAVTLFFPGDGGRLYREPRQLPLRGDLRERAALLIESLLAGPATAQLRAPLPTGTALRGIDLTADGVLYVDLQPVDGSTLPPVGSRREMLMLYSLVDTLAFNLDGVERVGVLWNGVQPTTFAGHIDTTHPLAPDTSLVAEVR